MENFLINTYNNIDGITVIDSGKVGKNIGIIAITHGNEPVGLEIFQYLINNYKVQEKLNSGKLYLIANNIKAYKKYIEDGDSNKNRFLNDNMNRITNKEYKNGSYEYDRFYELKPIFDELDVVIDIHSVSKGNDLIGIIDKNYLQQSKTFFDVETILVDNMIEKGAIISEFIRHGKEAYGIECGNHINKNGFENGVHNVLNFLGYCGNIEYKITKIHKNPNIYEFFQEIYVKSDKFNYQKDYIGFTKLDQNETFAIDDKLEYQNIFGDDIYLGIVTNKPQKGDGAGFLFKKLK